MRINFGDGTLRGNLLAASKLAAMDQKPQSSELFEAAAARIADLEAALRLCLDDCIDPTEGEIAFTRARELLGMK